MTGGPLVESVEREIARIADRLRTFSLVRLGEPVAGHSSRAAAVRAVVQALADAAAGLEGGPRREVPRLADAAVGDQLAVIGADLVAAGGSAPAAVADPVLDRALRELVDLRRLI